MDRSTRTWIVALLLGLAGIVALGVMKYGKQTEQERSTLPTIEAHPEPSQPLPEVAEAAKPSADCSGQQLEIALDGNVERVCMGTLTTKQNGSVRALQVATLTAPQRWLRVEVAGSEILSAAWGNEMRPDFRCQVAECSGITISRRDAQGARVMTFDRAPLTRTDSNAMSSTQEPLQLSGTVQIPPEELSDLACADQGVSIVTSDSSSQTFCPQGGAGFEIVDDGTKRYRFTSLDGDSIFVATDQNQQIRHVQYQGEVTFGCRSSVCSGVQISEADSDGTRRFTFSGTTLIETVSGQSSAVLNGSLILPPL